LFHTRPGFRSRVFSTPQRFPGKRKFHGLVSCRNRSWASPSVVFPSEELRAPLRAASSHAVVHRSAEAHPSRPCHPLVSPTPRPERRSCLVPPQSYGIPFGDPGHVPVCLDRKRNNRSIPSASPTSKPYPSSRVRSLQHEQARTERRYYPEVLPSRDLTSNLGFSTRPKPEGPDTHSPRRDRAATPGNLRPPALGEAFPA